MNNTQIECIVENGLNTCYIDSLFVSLFYKYNDNILSILDNEPSKLEGFYLQELIRLKFIEPIQRNYSISSSTINEIRNYSIICGWSQDGNIDEQKDCSEYYKFIAELFNIQPLQLEIFEVKDNVLTDNNKKYNFPFITLNLNQDDNIKNLFINWINTSFIKNNLQHNIINCYKLTNIPQFIIFNINRFGYNGVRNKHKLDIMKRIKFFGINDNSQDYIKWKISSIICHKGKNYNSGHYYCLVYTNQKKWILFDDEIIPSFEEIDLENEDLKDKIMLDAVMLIYTLE
jgi:uncharacterized UBP type Zn finger protein